MPKPKCYVIMPFGGNDEERKDHYNLVYELFIRIPAEQEGFEVIRSDKETHVGSITKNIIRNLATADLVIADIVNIVGRTHKRVRPTILFLCIAFDIAPVYKIQMTGCNGAKSGAAPGLFLNSLSLT